MSSETTFWKNWLAFKLRLRKTTNTWRTHPDEIHHSSSNQRTMVPALFWHVPFASWHLVRGVAFADRRAISGNIRNTLIPRSPYISAGTRLWIIGWSRRSFFNYLRGLIRYIDNLLMKLFLTCWAMKVKRQRNNVLLWRKKSTHHSMQTAQLILCSFCSWLNPAATTWPQEIYRSELLLTPVIFLPQSSGSCKLINIATQICVEIQEK